MKVEGCHYEVVNRLLLINSLETRVKRCSSRFWAFLPVTFSFSFRVLRCCAVAIGYIGTVA